MITVTAFLAAVKENARRIKSYRLGRDGSDGTCDCVGLIIGALRLAGVTYKRTHGSNYFARYYTDGLRKITSVDQLEPGMVIYKAHEPGESGYDDNVKSKYGKSGDLRDYYHIGVVQSVRPLCIAHCSSGGMHYDTKRGKWSYAGYCKGVDYMADADAAPSVLPGETAVVDVPNDGTLNVRSRPALNGQILTRIREGDTVEVLETQGEWARIRCEVGWVQKKFLKGGK